MILGTHQWRRHLKAISNSSPDEQRRFFQKTARLVRWARHREHRDLAEIEYALLELEDVFNYDYATFASLCMEAGLDPRLEHT